MTSRLDNLRALYDAVKAGTATDDHVAAVFDPNDREQWRLNCFAVRAFDGSLDAALALHKAVLPGWLVLGLDQDSKRHWYVTLSRVERPYYAHEGDDNPSRAWLLAILRALITAAEGTEGATDA